MKLFCLPFAGGSASVYSKWRPYLLPNIELVPIELAGRGSRFNESQYETFQDCIEDVFYTILNKIDTPYAIFGHSMGASIAFEVAQKLADEAMVQPTRLFLSARRSPQSTRPVKHMHTLEDNKFIEELRNLGGTPEEILTTPSFLDIFLPIIREDYRILYSSGFKPSLRPLDVPFSILNGKSDDLYPQEITGWGKLTSGMCDYQFFDGGHFYIDQKYQEIVRYINLKLILENQSRVIK